MTFTNPSRPLVALGIGVGLGVVGTTLYYQWSARKFDHNYTRQLEGRLTDKERQLEAQNAQLGTAQSKLMSQDELEKRYQAQLSEKDKAFEAFRREHDLKIKSMTDDLESLQERVSNGRGRVTEVAPQPAPGNPSTPAWRPAIAYDYSDADGRFHLTDPDIWVEGNETLDVKQLFELKREVFAQTNGSLMTERLQLAEVVKAEDGSYREVAQASLVNAHFTYVNPPPPPPASSQNGLGLSWMLTAGLRVPGPWHPRWVRFGGAVNVFQLGELGLAGGLSSDLELDTLNQFLHGTGGEVLVTWRPDSRLNVRLGAGIHLPLANPTAVQPALNVGFILY